MALYEVNKIGEEDKPLSESTMTAKNLTELKAKVKDKYGTTKGFRVQKRSKSGGYHHVNFDKGGSIKGRNNKTGETFGVVIGSKKSADDYTENAKGGEVRYFDRHANMGGETRGEILEYVNYPILKEYFGKNDDDDTEYEEVKTKLLKLGFDRWDFQNSLNGMFDGYDYTKTKDFQEYISIIKKADPKFHKKITRIIKEIQSYPTTEQPNQGNFSKGGSMADGGGVKDILDLPTYLYVGGEKPKNAYVVGFTYYEWIETDYDDEEPEDFIHRDGSQVVIFANTKKEAELGVVDYAEDELSDNELFKELGYIEVESQMSIEEYEDLESSSYAEGGEVKVVKIETPNEHPDYILWGIEDNGKVGVHRSTNKEELEELAKEIRHFRSLPQSEQDEIASSYGQAQAEGFAKGGEVRVIRYISKDGDSYNWKIDGLNKEFSSEKEAINYAKSQNLIVSDVINEMYAEGGEIKDALYGVINSMTSKQMKPHAVSIINHSTDNKLNRAANEVAFGSASESDMIALKRAANEYMGKNNSYAEGGEVIPNIEDSEGNSLSKGDKVILVTTDEEFLNPEEGKWAERGDSFEIIRHLGESEGYSENSNSIEMKHLKTGEKVSFAGFRMLKVNPQYNKGGAVSGYFSGDLAFLNW